MRTEASINSALRFAIWQQENSKHRFVRAVPASRSIQEDSASLLMEIAILELKYSSIAKSPVVPGNEPKVSPEENHRPVTRSILMAFEQADLSFDRL